MNDTPVIRSREQILRRIRGEYLEMPGLRLTFPQAQRLWGLDATTCASLLMSLVEQDFLCYGSDGTYSRTSDGAERFPSPKMAKMGSAPVRTAALMRIVSK
jgi:hypothetical protein